MTCSAAMRRTGPFRARETMILLSMGRCSRSAWREMEMAFATYETQAARMAGLVADFFGTDAQFLPSIGAIGETDIGPPILVPVAGIGDVGIGKSKIALGLWIVSGFVGEIDLLAVAFLDFLVDRAHIDGLLLVGGGRGEKHEQVVALSRRSLRGSLRGKVDKVDVVDDDVGVVFLSPLFAEGPVEPSVVSGNEVAPLENF